jgi:Recombination endonuclease VII
MSESAERRDALNARRREQRAQDPDRRAKDNARQRAYYEAHKEKLRAHAIAYYHAHREEIRKRAGAYYQAHKEAINDRMRATREARKQANDPSLRSGKLKRLYGISAAEYDALLAKQGGVCAICRKRSKGRLCVDHCHLTGTVRGLLCSACNVALGYLKDDQASLVAALAYLGALPRDGPGFAAQRALAVHAALPPWPTRRAVLTYPPIRCDAPGSRERSNSSNKGDHMTIDDASPAGGKPTQPMRDALDAELARAGGDGEGHNMLQLIARRLASKALEGDIGAIREIFDRIDGKSVAGSAPEQTPGKVQMQWKE